MRHALERYMVAAVIGTTLLACGTDLVSPSPDSLNGRWVRLNEVPGSSEVWDLAVQGSTITGTGAWTGEACCHGMLTISGLATSDSVHLDVTLFGDPVRPTTHEHFDGVLLSRVLLAGQGTVESGPTSPERLQKQ